MKKISKALLFIALPAMAAVSCAKENIEPARTARTQTVTFSATAAETKTVFGEKDGNSYPTLWTSNEQVAVSYNGKSAIAADVTPSGDGKSAAFSLEIEKDADANAHKFFAVSPSASVTDVDKEDNSFYIYIPSTQAPLSDSCEEKAQIIAASKEYPDGEFDNHVEFNFKHISAYGNMSVVLPSDAGTVEAVALSASAELTGHFNYSFVNDELLGLDATETVTVKTNKTEGIFFAVAPVDLSDKKMTVTVTTDKGVYAKEIDLNGKTLKFVAGQVSKFAVSGFTQSAARSEAWTLVTDASTLAVGDKLVIASNDKGVVAGDIVIANKKSIMASVGNAKFSSDKISLVELPSDAVILTLGGTANSWTLANENAEKLGGASSVGNVYWDNGITTWKITIDNEYGATIQVSTSTSTNRFLYNVNSPRFLTYSSAANASMLLPQLYRLSLSSALVAPTNVNAAVDGKTITVTWDAVAGAKDYTVTCTGQAEQTVSGTSYTFENLEYDTEYAVSVVANPKDASVSKSAASTATVKTGENPNPYLTVTPSEYKDEIPAAGDVLTFSVKTNQSNWTVSSTDEANFKTAVLSDYSGFTVTVAANDGDARSATIAVSAGSASDVVMELSQQSKSSLSEEIIYTCGFESSEGFTTSQSYQGTVTSVTTGKQWKVHYGTPSTSSKISGSQSLAMRLYSSNNYGYSQMEFDLKNVTKVEYKAKAATSGNAKILLNTFYSTDGGKNWIQVDTDKTLSTTATSYTFTVSANGAFDSVRVKFAISPNSTKPSKSSIQLTIDDIAIYGMK